MKLASIERYRFHRENGRFVIRMRQVWNAAGVAVVAAIFLWLGWRFMSSNREFFWMWTVVCSFFLLASGFGALYRETITLEGSEIRMEASVGRERRRAEVGPSVRVLVEQQRPRRRVFPFLVHFCDADGGKTGAYLQFRASRNVDKCLDLLRRSLPVEWEDLRGKKLSPDEQFEIEIQQGPEVFKAVWRGLRTKPWLLVVPTGVGIAGGVAFGRGDASMVGGLIGILVGAFAAGLVGSRTRKGQ